MITGTAIVVLIATAGWLVLNIRALQSHGLSFRQQATMAAAWVAIFAALAVLFTRASE